MSASARVLIVDADSRILSRHSGLLKDPGTGVLAETVATIGEAVARVGRSGYDAVVCRVDSPDEASFLIRLRKAAPRVPLVAVTQRPNPALEDLAREIGVDDVQCEAGEPREVGRKAAVRIRRLIARTRAIRGRSRELRAQTRELVAEHRRLVTRNRLFSKQRIESVVAGLGRFVPLLVEDSADQALLFKRALTKAALPFPLPVMRDGGEAIDFLAGRGEYADRGRHPAPTLVVLDINMPRMTGIEVLSWMRLRPEFAQLPVYMLTTSEFEFDQALALGANDYFLKPTSFEGLVDVVRTITVRWWFYEQAREFRCRFR